MSDPQSDSEDDWLKERLSARLKPIAAAQRLGRTISAAILDERHQVRVVFAPDDDTLAGVKVGVRAMERELWAHSRKDIVNCECADGARCASSVVRLLVEDAARATPREVDVLDLDTALDELAAFDRRRARVAELRFFAGLSLEEIGLVLDTSLATTMRDWQAAHAWLFKRLTQGKARPTPVT